MESSDSHDPMRTPEVSVKTVDLEDAIAAMHEGFFLLDSNGLIRACNPAAEQMLGMSAEDMLGLSVYDPAFRPVYEDGSPAGDKTRPSAQALRHGASYRGRTMGVHTPHRGRIWVDINATPLFQSASQDAIGAIVTFEDITERKQTDDYRAHLEAIVQSSKDAIASVSLDGTVLTWSPGAEAMYGRSAESVVGKHASTLAGGRGKGPVDIAIEQLREGKIPPAVEVSRRRPDGTPLTVFLTFSPIKDFSGNLQAVAIVGHDISGQKKAEADVRRSQVQLSLAQSVARIGSWEYDPKNGRIGWSDEMFRLMYLDPNTPVPDYDEIIKRYHPDDAEHQTKTFLAAMEHGKPFDFEFRILHPDGTYVWRHLLAKPVVEENGKVSSVHGTMMDIDSRKRAEDASEKIRRDLVEAQRLAKIGNWSCSTDMLNISWSDEMFRIYETDPAIGPPTNVQIEAMYHPDDAELRADDMAAAFGNGLAFDRHRRILFDDGRIKYIRTIGRPVFDDSGNVREVFGTVADITAAREAELSSLRYQEELKQKMEQLARVNAELETLATTDGMTGLKNHRTFHVRLGEEYSRAKRYATPLSLLMIDVDLFKQYNDTYGHPEGDVVLTNVADILRSNARESDTVARYGGEEFAMLLPDTDEAGARMIAERLRISVQQAGWQKRDITISIGVSSNGGEMVQAAELLSQSDRALYQSKIHGRNRTTVYDCTWKAGA